MKYGKTSYAYIAAPFFNDVQVLRVKEIEDELTKIGLDFYSPMRDGILKEMTKEEREKEAPRLFERNCSKLNGCDTLIILIDDPDTGTAWEMGYLCGLRDADAWIGLIVTVTFKDKPVNVMLREPVDCHVAKIEDLGPAIRGEIKIKSKVKDTF